MAVHEARTRARARARAAAAGGQQPRSRAAGSCAREIRHGESGFLCLFLAGCAGCAGALAVYDGDRAASTGSGDLKGVRGHGGRAGIRAGRSRPFWGAHTCAAGAAMGRQEGPAAGGITETPEITACAFLSLETPHWLPLRLALLQALYFCPASHWAVYFHHTLHDCEPATPPSHTPIPPPRNGHLDLAVQRRRLPPCGVLVF